MSIIQLDIKRVLAAVAEIGIHHYVFLQLMYEGNEELAYNFNIAVLSEQDREYLQQRNYLKWLDEGAILKSKALAMFGGSEEAVETWIEEYRTKFPRYKKGDRPGCIKKMRKFLKERKFDKETILQATDTYMIEMAREQFRYTKQADYFIEKNGLSALGGYCETVLEGPEEDQAYIGIKQI